VQPGGVCTYSVVYELMTEYQGFGRGMISSCTLFALVPAGSGARPARMPKAGRT
jgi:hypothetical protein